MAKPRLFVGENVMHRVAAELPRRGLTRAAIAYVTRDHLGMRSGDAIAANVSLAAVRSGATDPTLLLELLERDVIVVNQPRLHAKAIVRGATVAVGSANLSEKTLGLDELMWVTKDETLVRRTSRWLQKLLSPDPMKSSTLESLAAQFGVDPTPWTGGVEGAGHEPAGPALQEADPFRAKTVDRLWLWRGRPVCDQAETSDSAASTVNTDSDLAGKEWIRNSSAATTLHGDVWIKVSNGRLLPPRRVLKARSSDTAPDGSFWTLVGYGREARGVAIPGWVNDKYGPRVADDLEALVDADDIEMLLALFRQ